jgi:hypothetical protein
MRAHDALEAQFPGTMSLLYAKLVLGLRADTALFGSVCRLSKVKQAPGVGVVPDGFVLHEPFPNPASGDVVLGYELPFPADVMLAVYDMMGVRRMVVASGSRDAGVHSDMIAARALASGSYILRLTAADITSGEQVAASRVFQIVK